MKKNFETIGRLITILSLVLAFVPSMVSAQVDYNVFTRARFLNHVKTTKTAELKGNVRSVFTTYYDGSGEVVRTEDCKYNQRGQLYYKVCRWYPNRAQDSDGGLDEIELMIFNAKGQIAGHYRYFIEFYNASLDGDFDVAEYDSQSNLATLTQYNFFRKANNEEAYLNISCSSEKCVENIFKNIDYRLDDKITFKYNGANRLIGSVIEEDGKVKERFNYDGSGKVEMKAAAAANDSPDDYDWLDQDMFIGQKKFDAKGNWIQLDTEEANRQSVEKIVRKIEYWN